MAKTPDALLPTRRSLLSRLKNWEDRESWQEFFDTYWRLIYGVALKAGLRDGEAQEVVQETVITVSRKMQEFRYDPSIGTFKSWLLHTTRWKIADQFRKRLPVDEPRRPAEAPTTSTSPIERIPDPASLDLGSDWDQEWERNLYDAARERVKRRVNSRQYQMFDLYVMKEMPVRKVCAALGVNAGRVYLAKHRISALIAREVKRLETQSL